MVESLMLVFPILFLASFVLACSDIFKGQRQGIMLFLIFGLPIYTTTLSLVFSNGLGDSMPVFQLLKEFIIILVVSLNIWYFRGRVRLHTVDYLVLSFFLYTLLYVIIPVGDHDTVNRMIAFKNTSFFALVYMAGRLLNTQSIYIRKYFKFILFLAILAGIVLILEVMFDDHFQHYTGYADYNVNFLNFEASGDEGLTFTFETENGLKRFASFFSNPIEYAASSLIALAVIAGLYTDDRYKFRPDTLGVLALICTFLCIMFTISRAPFVSYFGMIYFYSLLTGKKQIIFYVNGSIIAAVLYLFFITDSDDIQKFIINTINFTDSSSVGHVLDWLEGLAALSEKPLGLGLGASGRVGVTLGTNTGGHNQFLIVGVQTGVISMLIYIAIYAGLVASSWRWYYKLKGKAKQVCLMVLLLKIGLFIPLFTSEIEASPYVSYMSWFFSGYLISLIMHFKYALMPKQPRILPAPAVQPALPAQ